jgi:hypothetical protein
MADRFVEIKREQMHEFLNCQGFKLMDLPNVGEIVYGKRVDKDGEKLTVRVYTSLNKNGGSTREKGTDAIRVSLFRFHDDKPSQLATRRNYRTKGWASSVQKNINELTEFKLHRCTAEGCGGLLVPRQGKNGAFLGCSNFPKGCRQTAKIES